MPVPGNFKSFRSARAFVRGLGLKSGLEWQEYLRSGKRPDDIPSTPHRQYRGQWVSMRDWLGLPPAVKPRTFARARAYVRKLKFENQQAFKKWARSKERPEDIPVSPDQVYAEKGWDGWADFLGNRNFGKIGRTFRPFREARAFARRLGLKSWRDWRRWAASDKRPPDIPAKPADIYADSGWVNVADWLGYWGRFPRARYVSKRELGTRALERRRLQRKGTGRRKAARAA